jgi:parallel beta-helix repeat protein
MGLRRLTGPIVLGLGPALLLPQSLPAQGQCLRVERAGTVIRGDTRVCAGRYRVPDPSERGVIVVAAPGLTIDLTGVTLESGDSVPSRFQGVGILARNVDSVTIRGGRIRGYRYGIRIEGGSGHVVSGVQLNGSRAQAQRSTPDRFDEGDWLDIFHPDSFELYGGGLYLKGTRGARVTGVLARGAQNGIGLFESRDALLVDNDVSGNSGWGIQLWKSSHNVIIRNRADHDARCESPTYRRGCDSAALLLRQQSDSNFIAENDLTWSGDGFFLSGQRGEVSPSIGNVVVRNDASHAWHNAFEATFSGWNVFLENRADSSDYGFWLGYSTNTLVSQNLVLGSASAGIAIEHGRENEITGNTILGGESAIHLFAPRAADDPSTDYRIEDNTVAKARRGIVLERTSRVRLHGNRFDALQDALVADSGSADAEVSDNVFLNVARWFIDAVRLDAGGNYWAAAGVDSVKTQIRGLVKLEPFRRAEEAGY